MFRRSSNNNNNNSTSTVTASDNTTANDNDNDEPTIPLSQAAALNNNGDCDSNNPRITKETLEAQQQQQQHQSKGGVVANFRIPKNDNSKSNEHEQKHDDDDDRLSTASGSSWSSFGSNSNNNNGSKSNRNKPIIVAVTSCKSASYNKHKPLSKVIEQLPNKAPSVLKMFHELAIGVIDAYEASGIMNMGNNCQNSGGDGGGSIVGEFLSNVNFVSRFFSNFKIRHFPCNFIFIGIIPIIATFVLQMRNIF